MKKLLAILLVATGLSVAQLPNAPTPHYPKHNPDHSMRNIWIANGVNLGASITLSLAAKYGSDKCRIEDANSPGAFGHDSHGGDFHPINKSLKVTLPLDAGLTVTSFILHKKGHNNWALLIPSGSATAQFGVAGTMFSQGCS